MTTTPPPHARRVGFLPRFAAELVDLVVFWAVFFVMAGLWWAAAGIADVASETTTFLGAAFGWVVALGYWIVLHAHGRQTAGKWLIGAVVVHAADFGPISYRRAAGRLLSEVASALPFNLGYLWILWDPERQGLHDKLARTLVVKRQDLRLG